MTPPIVHPVKQRERGGKPKVLPIWRSDPVIVGMISRGTWPEPGQAPRKRTIIRVMSSAWGAVPANAMTCRITVSTVFCGERPGDGAGDQADHQGEQGHASSEHVDDLAGKEEIGRVQRRGVELMEPAPGTIWSAPRPAS